MSSARSIVGLIANPLSGKDIRRVVAHATVVPNHEKVGILRRALLGMAAFGLDEVLAMPDSGRLVRRALEGLALPFTVRELEMPLTGSAQDTRLAAALMREAGAGCIIALGGDGTSRAAAAACGDVPLLPLSTGTNNAFPLFLDGTLAGMAAASVAHSGAAAMVRRAPMIELLHNTVLVDSALVDVAIFAGGLGSGAVWELEQVRLVVTTKLSPGTLGLSAIGGAVGGAAPAGTLGVAVTLGGHQRTILAPVGPGVVSRLAIKRVRWLKSDEQVELPIPAAIALDGEREHLARDGNWSVRVRERGPLVVIVHKALRRLYGSTR